MVSLSSRLLLANPAGIPRLGSTLAGLGFAALGLAAFAAGLLTCPGDALAGASVMFGNCGSSENVVIYG